MPFCKICYDSGNIDYASHNIRTFNIRTKQLEVTCSYLKNITCTRCGKKQHTAKYCKEDLTKINEQQFDNIKKAEIKHVNDNSKFRTAVSNPTNNVKINNGFSNAFTILCDHDDEYDPVSYTADGEFLGKVKDIIWGVGIRNIINTRWVDNIK